MCISHLDGPVAQRISGVSALLDWQTWLDPSVCLESVGQLVRLFLMPGMLLSNSAAKMNVTEPLTGAFQKGGAINAFTKVIMALW